MRNMWNHLIGAKGDLNVELDFMDTISRIARKMLLTLLNNNILM